MGDKLVLAYLLLIVSALWKAQAITSHRACDYGEYLYTPPTQVQSNALAGTGTASSIDGAINTATFNQPSYALESPDGLSFLVAGNMDHAIRFVSRSSTSDPWTTVGKIAGGTMGMVDGTVDIAQFSSPWSLDISSNGTAIVVCDSGNHAIRWIQRSDPGPSWGNATVSTIAGSPTIGFTDGPVSSAKFNQPKSVILSSDETYIIVSESGNHALRLIKRDSISTSWNTATVSTIGGNGVAGCGACTNVGIVSAATFSDPIALALAKDELTLFVSDRLNCRVRIVERTDASQAWNTSTITTIVGDGSAQVLDGVGTSARVLSVYGLALSEDDLTLIIADSSVRYMRRISASDSWLTASVVTIQASGITTSSGVTSAFVFRGTRSLAVVLRQQNKIKRIGNGIPGCNPDTFCDPGSYFVQGSTIVSTETVAGTASQGAADGNALTATFSMPTGAALAPDGLSAAIADSNNYKIRLLARDSLSSPWNTGLVSLVGGSIAGYQEGAGTNAKFNVPRSVRYSASGQTLYIADTNGHYIRAIERTNVSKPWSAFSTYMIVGVGLAGSRDGVVAGCTLSTCPEISSPWDLVVHADGTTIVWTDYGNHRIRTVTRTLGQTWGTAVVDTVSWELGYAGFG